MSETLTVDEAADLLAEAEPAVTPEEDPETLPVSEPGGEAESEGADEEVEATENEGEPLFTVKVDGKESQVTADELVTSYQLQKHLDNKLSEVNRERTTLSQDKEHLQRQAAEAAQARAEYVAHIEQVQALLAQQMQTPPDPTLITENPEEFVRQQQAYQASQERFRALDDRKQQEIAKAQQEHAANLDKTKREQLSILQRDIPEWNDVERLRSDVQAIEQFSKEQYGLTDQEISAVYDARYVKILRDARNYHQMLAAAETAKQKKVKGAAPVIRSSGGQKAKPKTGAEQAEEKFRKSTKGFDTNSMIDAAADLLVARKR